MRANEQLTSIFVANSIRSARNQDHRKSRSKRKSCRAYCVLLVLTTFGFQPQSIFAQERKAVISETNPEFKKVEIERQSERQRALASEVFSLMESGHYDKALAVGDWFIEIGGDPTVILNERANCMIEIGEPEMATAILEDHFRTNLIHHDMLLSKGDKMNWLSRAYPPNTILALAVLAKARMTLGQKVQDPDHSVATVMNHLYCKLEAIFTSKETHRQSEEICNIGIACAIRCIQGCKNYPGQFNGEVEPFLEMLTKCIEAPKQKAQLQSLRLHFRQMTKKEPKGNLQQNKRLESLLEDRREARRQLQYWEREAARWRAQEDSVGKIAGLGNAEIMADMFRGDLAAAETALRQFQEGAESNEASLAPAAKVFPEPENRYSPSPLNYNFMDSTSPSSKGPLNYEFMK